MAAAPSKPSPTNSPLKAASNPSTLVDNKMDGAAKLPAGEPANEVQAEQQFDANAEEGKDDGLPSYETSENSLYYTSGKAMMQSGDFDQALDLIVQGLEQTRAQLVSISDDGSNSIHLTDEEIDLHESLAPFHYLYGTTLLYSIEESPDDQQQMTVGGRDESQQQQQKSTDGDEGEDNESAIAASLGGGDMGANNIAVSADDMEIAWENLDASRTIVQRLLQLASNDTSNNDGSSLVFKYKTDLAQILLREGDLQRFNSRYDEAIIDYQACLDLRMKLLAESPKTGEPAEPEDTLYSRKIADVHYNLGLSHLTYASELQKEPDSSDGAAAPASPAQPQMDEATRKIKTMEHRLKGIHHHVECAKVLSGRIVLLCGQDPEAVLAAAIAGSSADDESSKRSATAGFKTTGLDESACTTSDASQQLSRLRKAVADLQANDVAGAATAADLKEFLDELQETVDESAQAEDAIRQASAIRVEAQKAAALDGTVTTALDGSTTQIGFGSATMSASDGAAVNDLDNRKPADVETAAFAASTSSPATAPHMMVVKKRKKRQILATIPENDEDSKPPSAKRAKAE